MMPNAETVHGSRTWRRIIAAAVCTALVTAAGYAQPSAAPSLSDAAAPAQRPDDAPTISQAHRAVDVVRLWLASWDTMKKTEKAPPPAWGACVELRLEGMLVGRGVAMSAVDGVDRAEVLARAARGAMRQAAKKLKLEDVGADKELREGIAKRLMVSVQLAERPTPIKAAARTDLDGLLSPGLEGLAMSREQAIEAQFPSEMFVEGRSASQASAMVAGVLLKDATLGLAEPAALADRHGVTLMKFGVVHAAQAKAEGLSIALYRGSALVDQNRLDSVDELKAFAASMRDALSRRLDRAINGEGEDDAMDTISIATCTLAGARAAMLVDKGSAGGFAAGAFEGQLLDAIKIDDALNRPSVAAMVLAAINESSHTRLNEERTKKKTALMKKCVDVVSNVMVDAEAMIPKIHSSERGVFLWATASGACGALAKEKSRKFVESLIAEVPSADLPSLMPWAGWAALECGGGVGGSALVKMRETVFTHQLTQSDLDGRTLDMLGGVVFTKGRNALPNWHAARVIAFNAATLRVESMTSKADRTLVLTRSLSGLRFLRQLQVDESCRWAGIGGENDLGHIRLSAWTTHSSADATALATLAVCEMVRSIEAVAGK